MISGVEITPTLAATRSPIDLDIASPGVCSFLNHTLEGPINVVPSLIGSIRPPEFSILTFSSGSSGLLSLDKGIAVHPCLVNLPIIALESPQLAQIQIFP